MANTTLTEGEAVGPVDGTPLTSGGTISDLASASEPSTDRRDIVPVPKLSGGIGWPWKKAEAPAPAAEISQLNPAEESPLSFGHNMWDRFELLWKERIEPSQRLLEQVTEVLRSRAALERKYGESLLSFSCDVKLDSQLNSVHGAVEAVMVNFKNRGEQSIELAEQVDQDIVSSLEVVIRQHREVSQRIFRDVQLLLRYCQEKRHLHEKLARRYGSRCMEAEAVAQECIQGLAMKATERLKLAQKATVLSKQARIAEHEYYASIDQTNRAQTLYDKHMPLVLAALQDLEVKRGKCLKDGLMKLAVYETSWLRNLQYDLESSVKAAEGVDISKDLQTFIAAHQVPGKEGTKGLQLTPQGFWTCAKHKEQVKTPPPTWRNEVQAMIRQFMDEVLRPPLHGILKDGAPASTAEELKETLEQVRLAVGDARKRAGFCQMLRAEVLAREPQGTEIENAAGVSVHLANFEAIVPLVRAALDACSDQADHWCGRDLMVIVNLIRSQDDTGKTVSLLSRVYNHALWNKVTFWEDILLIGLCEAHSAEAVWRRSLPPGSQFTQPAMTAFLQRFLGYMMAFGISFDQGRNSVWATLRKNTSLLGVTCKPYSDLLLQAYEAQAVPSTGTGKSASSSALAGGASGAAIVGSDRKLEANGETVSSNAAEDDFEALALGLPPEEPQPSTGDAASGCQDSAEEEEAAEDGKQVDEALKELAEAQPSVDDVFT